MFCCIGRSALAVMVAFCCIGLWETAAAQATTSYSYDTLGRANGVVYPNGDAVAYSYDAVGNRTQLTATSSTPAPTVSAKTLTTTFNTAGSVNLAPSGAYTSVAVAAGPTKGTVTLLGATATYTPNAGTYGSDSFTFTATGLGGTSASATVSVTVIPPAPTISAKSISTTYNTNGAVDLAPTGVWTSIVFPSAPTKGALGLAGSIVTYVPSNGTFGADSFIFTATGPGGTSAPATVSVTVANPPAPTVSAKSISTAYETAGTVNLAPSGVSTSVAVATGPAKGSVSISGTTATYTPIVGTHGSDSFTFTATGPGGTSAPAIVSVTVANPSAPTVSAKSISTAYETAGAVNLAPSGVHTSVAVATGPAKGSVSISGTTATYTPIAGTYGSDSFTFTATGPGGTSAPATVSITVAVPAAPTASNTSLSVGYNSTANLALPIAGVVTSVVIDNGPTKGTVSVSGTAVIYTATWPNYGADSFTYHAVGPGGSSSVWTVAVTIGNGAAPVASNGAVSTAFNTPVTFTYPAGGDYGYVVLDSVPAHGSVSAPTYVVNVGTQSVYTPATGYSGADSFTFHAASPFGASPVRTMSVTVGPPPNQAPVALGDSMTISGSIEDLQAEGCIDPRLNDTDADGDPLTIIDVSQPSGAHATFSASEVCASAAPANRSTSFTYTISDGRGGQATATITLIIRRVK